MLNRRRFLSKSFLTSLGLPVAVTSIFSSCENTKKESTATSPTNNTKPIIISTWIHGIEANAAAMKTLEEGGSVVDAVENGVRVTEADPEGQSVGIGGLPDRDGNVTLDACIMDEKGNAGSVCFLQNIKHPISVARKVMEETPHVLLAGKGALEFAKSQGFEEENLLTEAARKKWEEWKKESDYKPIINVENHDTIGLLAVDADGNIAGACTTSGLAFKLHGRVGDSPIIGAGLFVDNEVGGATATGMGEAVLKSVGSFLVVELMRQGYSPADACKEAVQRIVRRQPNHKDIQVGYIAVNKQGEYGGYAIHPGFGYAVFQDGKNEYVECASEL